MEIIAGVAHDFCACGEDFLFGSEPPRDTDGEQVGTDGGLHVGVGVADVSDALRVGGKLSSDPFCAGRIGFSGETIAMTEGQIEWDIWEETLDA